MRAPSPPPKGVSDFGLSLPTPVERLDSLSTATSTLYVKRDDQTHPVYGGNKARKLARIFQRVGNGQPVVTLGAAGSHHVLASAIFGRRFDHVVHGVLLPQPKTPHVIENLRAGIHQGLIVHPARSMLTAAVRLFVEWIKGAFLITVGGSNVDGALAYVDAMHELDDQIRSGRLPRPDAVIITLGSGGTMAGIAAGAEELGWNSTIIGVVVTEPSWVAPRLMRHLARRVARERGHRFRGSNVRFEQDYLGRGYGQPTDAGARATKQAASVGLTLDATYTAKAFAATLDIVARGEFQNVLFWHTLSSAPLEPLMRGAAELPPSLGVLLS